MEFVNPMEGKYMKHCRLHAASLCLAKNNATNVQHEQQTVEPTFSTTSCSLGTSVELFDFIHSDLERSINGSLTL